MTFRVGQKVVCVNDGSSSGIPGSKGVWSGDAPVVGQIYTVRSVHTNNQGLPTLWLEEIARSQKAVDAHGPLIRYGPFRFRPLMDEPKGMKTLRSILNDPQQFIRKDQFDKEKM